jgi:hypothetical protein
LQTEYDQVSKEFHSNFPQKGDLSRKSPTVGDPLHIILAVIFIDIIIMASSDVRSKVQSQCSKFYQSFQLCKTQQTDPSKCERFEMKYLECAGHFVCPEELKQYTMCNRSIMGSGIYKGRRDCKIEVQGIKQCLEKNKYDT